MYVTYTYIYIYDYVGTDDDPTILRATCDTILEIDSLWLLQIRVPPL